MPGTFDPAPAPRLGKTLRFVDDEDALTAQLFGSLFVLMQRLSRRADDELASLTLTSRQWLLLAVITRAFPDASPTLSQAAAVYGTSRQNIKQIARQLQQQGWLRIVRDPDDARATRLELTDKVAVFADPAVQARQQQALTEMFGGLSPHERRARPRRAVPAPPRPGALARLSGVTRAHPSPTPPPGFDRWPHPVAAGRASG